MPDSIFRIVYGYDYIVSPVGKPSYERGGIGLLYIRAQKIPALPELEKLCRVHGKHPAGADNFIVVASSVASRYDLTGDEDVLNYDDEREEEI